jgi:phospholipase C
VGEFGFDFTRFGVRVPAVLVSPLIPAGTVFRGSGPIDHTSVLKTIQERWGTASLTARDQAAASLGDVLSLATPRTDDPLAGVTAPASQLWNDDALPPSKLDRIQAWKIGEAPLASEQGLYGHETPDLSSTRTVAEFIRRRSAAWRQSKQSGERV